MLSKRVLRDSLLTLIVDKSHKPMH